MNTVRSGRSFPHGLRVGVERGEPGNQLSVRQGTRRLLGRCFDAVDLAHGVAVGDAVPDDQAHDTGDDAAAGLRGGSPGVDLDGRYDLVD
jgi:hypothetical protein